MEPFASKYRPSSLEDFIGQDKLVGADSAIRKFIEKGSLPSMIFWGPPGSGKTTLAYIISRSVNSDFYKLSAVMSGKSKLMEIVKKAMKSQKELNILDGVNPKKTILFLDEIHRWNKSQQDSLLPYVEKGVVVLIGATTENPSFSLVPALLSRTRVFTFEKHTSEDIKKYLNKLISNLKKDGINIVLEEEALEIIARSADGDLRTSANILEAAYLSSGENISKESLKNSIETFLQYESRGEDHFNIISAVHKSLRDSDPNGGVYWVTRMLEAGDDPLYIARRLLRFASEDIGNADPQALVLANSVFETCQKLGRPECDVVLIQLAIYLAKSPKDNSAYSAHNKAKKDIYDFGSLPVPMHLRNAPTKLMKELGYGKGYKYAHDFKDAKVDQQHLPDKISDHKYI